MDERAYQLLSCMKETGWDLAVQGYDAYVLYEASRLAVQLSSFYAALAVYLEKRGGRLVDFGHELAMSNAQRVQAAVHKVLNGELKEKP